MKPIIIAGIVLLLILVFNFGIFRSANIFGGGVTIGDWHSASFDGYDLRIPAGATIPRGWEKVAVTAPGNPVDGINQASCELLQWEWDSARNNCLWKNTQYNKKWDHTIKCDYDAYAPQSVYGFTPGVNFDGGNYAISAKEYSRCAGEIIVHVIEKPTPQVITEPVQTISQPTPTTQSPPQPAVVQQNKSFLARFVDAIINFFKSLF